jgi:hypothetical protein
VADGFLQAGRELRTDLGESDPKCFPSLSGSSGIVSKHWRRFLRFALAKAFGSGRIKHDERNRSRYISFGAVTHAVIWNGR